MSTETPSAPAPLPSPAAPPPATNKRSCLLYGCGGLLALMLVIAGDDQYVEDMLVALRA